MHLVFFDFLVSMSSSHKSPCHGTTCPHDVSVGNKKNAHMMFALKETFQSMASDSCAHMMFDSCDSYTVHLSFGVLIKNLF